MKNKICYLVIDNTDDRDLLETAIRETELGYETIKDKSLERAKERFTHEPDFHPDYIFIDRNTGLLEFIKAIQHLAGIPVVVYTTDINAEGIEELKHAGAANCMLKTTHDTALTQILLRLFGEKETSFVLVYSAEVESSSFRR